MKPLTISIPKPSKGRGASPNLCGLANAYLYGSGRSFQPSTSLERTEVFFPYLSMDT
jgi:hypothetical protein